MTIRWVLVCALVVLKPMVPAAAQEGGLDPASLTSPLEDSWATYSGDLTGRRYSALTQVSTETVKTLTLAWTKEIDTSGLDLGGTNPEGRFGESNTFVGGEGTGDFIVGSTRIKGAILQVDGVLYVTAQDHVWALDARDGTERWHYYWKTRGGVHIGCSDRVRVIADS